MLLAAAGTVCLVMVVVTSIKAARRRLRYESWHLLHLYAYLGVGLALPHQLWTGQEFLSSTAAHRLLVDAVGAPRRPRCWSGGSGCRCGAALRHGLRVTSVVPEGDGVVSVYLTGRGSHRLPVEAGQFFDLALPDRARLDAARTRTRCPRRPTAAACGSPSRTLGDGSARAAAAPARHPGAGRGPVRPAQPTGPGPGRRSRSSAPASASRRCARWPRGSPTPPATPSCCTASPAQPLFAPRARRARRASAACRCCWLPGRRRAPDSWLGDGVGVDGRRPDRPARTGCPTSPTATSTSAAPSRGPTTSAAPPGRRPPR